MGEEINLYDIAAELRQEDEQLFEVFIEEFVIATEEKPGLDLESKSPEARQAYTMCKQLVEKMSFSEEQKVMLSSSKDGSLPKLQQKEIVTFRVKGEDGENYNFYDELKKLEAFDNELFDVFMEEHILAPSKPLKGLLVAKDVQSTSKRGLGDTPKREPHT